MASLLDHIKQNQGHVCLFVLSLYYYSKLQSVRGSAFRMCIKGALSYESVKQTENTFYDYILHAQY